MYYHNMFWYIYQKVLMLELFVAFTDSFYKLGVALASKKIYPNCGIQEL